MALKRKLWRRVGVPEARCVSFSAFHISAGVKKKKKTEMLSTARPASANAAHSVLVWRVAAQCWIRALNLPVEESHYSSLAALETHSCRFAPAPGWRLDPCVPLEHVEIKHHADPTLRFHSVLLSWVVHQEDVQRRNRRRTSATAWLFSIHPRSHSGAIRHVTRGKRYCLYFMSYIICPLKWRPVWKIIHRSSCASLY